MMCLTPFTVNLNPGKTTVPCGRCAACEIRRNGEKVTRQILEARSHGPMPGLFVTLTYEQAPLTEHGELTLDPAHLTNYFKRLRQKGLSFRYFACGEYGSRTHRPHYHANLFGLDSSQEDIVRSTWSDFQPGSKKGKNDHVPGFTQVAELNKSRMSYTAGYLIKDLSETDSWTGEAVPPFSRSSKRPAIGSDGIDELADRLATHFRSGTNGSLIPLEGAHWGIRASVNFIRFDGKKYPLDQWAKARIKARMGAEAFNRAESYFAYELRMEEHAQAPSQHQKKITENKFRAEKFTRLAKKRKQI